MSDFEYGQKHGAAGSCPLCKGVNSTLQYAGQRDLSVGGSSAYRCTTTTRSRPAVYACKDCGHWFTDPQEWPAHLDAEYEQLEDAEYLSLMEVKRRTFRRAGDLVSRFVSPPASLLEVGSYAGLFLDEMTSRGFSGQGIEPSTWGVHISRQRGHLVSQGVAEDVIDASMSDRFDVVVSWDVLEHVPDPGAFVQLLAQTAKPGGIVVFSTLDRTNWFPRVLGKRWPWIIPMHLHYFDQATVRMLGAKSGLEYLDTAPHMHYTTPLYAFRRLIRKVGEADSKKPSTPRIIIPVGLGDVRTYVFRKALTSP